MSTNFKGELVLKYLDEPVDGKWFKTVSPFSYKDFEVPAGTYTDFVAVPRGFFWLMDSVGEWFRTVRPFSYKDFEVPAGTYTDFASVPRGFLWLIDSVGKYGKAAVLHDWLCEKKIVPRKQADKIFLDAMKDLGVPWWKRRTMYAGVRTYSIFTFKK